MVLACLTSAPLLVGCGGPSELDEKCAKAFERAALTVDQVLSAEYECGGSFGNPSRDGTIVLSVDTQEQATPVIEDVYKAFASEQDLDSAWGASAEFRSEGDGKSFDDLDLEFNGSPTVGDMRDRYGISSADSD